MRPPPGLPCVVMVPAATSPAKIVQARAHGATVLAVQADYDATAALFKEALKAFGWYSCLSTNPWRNEGKKSYAFETWEDLRGETPDWMLHPIGGGLGVTACWKGWRELVALGWARGVPRMVAAQPAAADPITRAFEAGRDEVDARHRRGAPWPRPSRWARRSSAGAAWTRCAGPAGSPPAPPTPSCSPPSRSSPAPPASTASPRRRRPSPSPSRLRREGRIRPTDLVVCVVTGHGLKQPAGAVDEAGPLYTVAPDLAAIEAALTPTH